MIGRGTSAPSHFVRRALAGACIGDFAVVVARALFVELAIATSVDAAFERCFAARRRPVTEQAAVTTGDFVKAGLKLVAVIADGAGVDRRLDWLHGFFELRARVLHA